MYAPIYKHVCACIDVIIQIRQNERKVIALHSLSVYSMNNAPLYPLYFELYQITEQSNFEIPAEGIVLQFHNINA